MSRSGFREKILSMRCVLPEELGPTKSVQLLLLLLVFTLSFFGC